MQVRKMNLCYFLLPCLVHSSFIHFISAKQPKVTVRNGVVVGKYATSHYGKTYMSFEGIPYAKPPVNELRFKEPQCLDEEWVGEWNATSPGSLCMQHDHFNRVKKEDGSITFHISGDEDCLFLNVYTQESGPKNKDVVVMIHGGAFMFGGGNSFGPDYIMERDDIVYVTINYRLGPLGFLSTGDGVVPGNNGLKDQSLALDWVRRNIVSFGGDPNKVTIVGLSAGGASVHYHYFSPISNGLFKRGYSFSGSALCPWALVTDGPQKAKKLASYLGCPTTDSKTMVKCLRKRPARKIVNLVRYFQPWLYNPFTVFGPVVEVGGRRPFIDEHPRELLKQGKVKDLPWITGATSEDGLYPAADFVEDERLVSQLRKNWREYAPTLLYYNDRSSSNIAEKAKQAYMCTEDISMSTIEQLVHLIGDRLYVASAVESAALQAKHNTQPVYLYNYRFQGQRSVSMFLSDSTNLHGSCHGDDVGYLFKITGLDFHVDKDDKAMAELLGNILVPFIKNGTPKAPVKWPPVSKQTTDKVTYLDIFTPYKVELKNDAEMGNVKLLAEIFGDIVWKKDEL